MKNKKSCLNKLTLNALCMLEANPTLPRVPYQQTLGLIGTFESPSYDDLHQLHTHAVVGKTYASEVPKQLKLSF